MSKKQTKKSEKKQKLPKNTNVKTIKKIIIL